MRNRLCLLIFLFFVSLTFLGAQNILNNFKNELAIARKGKDFRKLADTYSALALYEEQTNRNYELSFEYFSRALEFYKVVKDTSAIHHTQFNIARHLSNNGMFPDAIQAFIELKAYFKSVFNNKKLTEIELQFFNIYLEKLEINKAKVSLDLAEELLNKIVDNKIEVKFIIEKIRYYEFVQELDTSMVLANLCIEKSLITGDKFDQAKCLALRGNIDQKKYNYVSAIANFYESLEYLNTVPYSKNRLEVYGNLAESFAQLDAYQKAYKYRIMYSELQDSILNERRLIAVDNITHKFESRQKSTEIVLLEKEKAFAQESNQQQKRALIVLGVALAGLLFGIYYIVRFYREKINTARIIEDQNNKINTQKIKELQDKIQINSMQSMIQGQEIERERIAKDLHDSLGGLLSTIKLGIDTISNKATNPRVINGLQNATILLDTAVSEVRTISQNLQPGALSRLGLIPALKDLINRYDNEQGPEIHFQYFDIPAKIDQTISLSIYRIIQEILNNAIKHANAKEVLLQLNRENGEIVIHIEDDGIGFDAKGSYNSMGLKNIKSRINYMKGSIEIDSRANEGTSYLIHINAGI